MNKEKREIYMSGFTTGCYFIILMFFIILGLYDDTMLGASVVLFIFVFTYANISQEELLQ